VGTHKSSTLQCCQLFHQLLLRPPSHPPLCILVSFFSSLSMITDPPYLYYTSSHVPLFPFPIPTGGREDGGGGRGRRGGCELGEVGELLSRKVALCARVCACVCVCVCACVCVCVCMFVLCVNVYASICGKNAHGQKSPTKRGPFPERDPSLFYKCTMGYLWQK